MTAANYIGIGMIAAAFLIILCAMAKDLGWRAAAMGCAGFLMVTTLLSGGMYLALST